jgi:hypothetical protein
MKLVSLIAVFAISATAQQSATPMGEVKNGVYHHLRTGIEIPLPSGRSVLEQSSSSDGGELVSPEGHRLEGEPYQRVDEEPLQAPLCVLTHP